MDLGQIVKAGSAAELVGDREARASLLSGPASAGQPDAGQPTPAQPSAGPGRHARHREGSTHVERD